MEGERASDGHIGVIWALWLNATLCACTRSLHEVGQEHRRQNNYWEAVNQTTLQAQTELGDVQVQANQGGETSLSTQSILWKLPKGRT